MKNQFVQLFIAFFCFCVLISCGSKENKNNGSPRNKSFTKIVSPAYNATFSVGQEIPLQLTSSDASIAFDSVLIICAENSFKISNSTKPIMLPTKGRQVGNFEALITVYLSNGETENKRVAVQLLSDIVPIEYEYKIINTYNHDRGASTQGLIFSDGMFYESTGLNGRSSLRKVSIKTGEVQKKVDIATEYFGEGIALLNKEIYQLTWQSRQGFVYDSETFEQKRKFNYPTEGWGLTTKQDTLILSDGTNNLYFIEPVGFTEVKRIQVYNHISKVDSLNELEYVNGQILANRWISDIIYIINPANGKVMATLDMSDIINPDDYNGRIDVLNGIAYNPITDNYYITGKLWPKLFEIKISPKKQSS